ncbi:MAG: enolase [Clostridiales bacterium]|jgi:O-antigen/teichoic acid export membrane protein|nr:enolase [Clostridiales bacterium]
MDLTSMASVAAITVICYLMAIVVKATRLDNKYIPVICGVLGGILGIVGMFVIPQYPAEDILNAAAVGIVSGLAATGVNQVYKQFTKGVTEE